MMERQWLVELFNCSQVVTLGVVTDWIEDYTTLCVTKLLTH